MPDLGGPLESATLETLGRTAARVHEERGLAADVYEGADEFLVLVDAPGAEAPDVQTRYVDGSLEVRVDRFRAFREDFDLRYPGRGVTLSTRVSLPGEATVDPDAAEAELRSDGTLWVRLPKVSAEAA